MDNWKDDIEKYLSGELSPPERHALEKKALTDPFLAEALEGAESISAKEFSSDLNSLNQKILGQNRNRFIWPLRIAASVVGIALISTVVFFSIQDDDSNNLASNQKPKEKEEAPKNEKTDSLSKSETQSIAESKDADVLTSTVKPKPRQREKTDELVALNENDEVKENNEIKPAVPDFEPTLSGGSGGSSGGGVIENQPSPVTTGPEMILTDSVFNTATVTTMPSTKNISIADRDDFLMNEGAEVASARAKETTRANKDEDSKLSKKSKATNMIVTGQVLDQQGQPLPGANILVKGTTSGAVTNVDGRYSIALSKEDATLVYSFIGFVSVEQAVDKSAAGELNIQLQEDASALSEVVVTGYGTMRRTPGDEPLLRQAEPIGGLKAYNQYLENEKIYPQQALDNKIEGKVIIEFTVTIAGAVTDFNVVRKLGYGCDEELIRLVKEGPKWRPSYVDNEAVESLVRVKTKFEIK